MKKEINTEVALMKQDIEYIKTDLTHIKQKIDELPEKLDGLYAHKEVEKKVENCEKSIRAIDLRMAGIAGGIAVITLLLNHFLNKII